MASPKNNLLEGPILRSLLTLAVPIVAANILQSAYQIIDAFWVGRLGGAAVAAVSLSFPVMFLMFAIGAGLSIAGSTLIAQFVGAGNHKMVGHVAGQTLLMVIAASLVLGTTGFFAAPALLRLMGVAPDVYDGALGFMRVSFIGPDLQFLVLRLPGDHALDRSRDPAGVHRAGHGVPELCPRSAADLRLGTGARLWRDGRGAGDARHPEHRGDHRHRRAAGGNARHPCAARWISFPTSRI